MKLQTLFEMCSRPRKINRTGDPVWGPGPQEIPRGQFIFLDRELIFLDTASFAQRIANFLFAERTLFCTSVRIFHEPAALEGYPKHHNMGSYRTKLHAL